jgi:uncharacterized OsmC-like protein
MKRVTVKSLENLQQRVVAGKHTLISDEPGDEGDDLGPTPTELLLASLGS